MLYSNSIVIYRRCPGNNAYVVFWRKSAKSANAASVGKKSILQKSLFICVI